MAGPLQSGGCVAIADAAACVRPLVVRWLGRVPYRDASALQESMVAERRVDDQPDTLLLLEHPPVITLGRTARATHVLANADDLAARGIEVHEARRGGDVTYHGPGQLVGYLIVDLARRRACDVGKFLRRIESALIAALDELGIAAGTRAGLTGVFIGAGGRRKIASIGIGLRGWITWHGFALNVTTDLTSFAAIVPCGLADVEMTSVERELGCEAPPILVDDARLAVARAFERSFA
ncbi:MAG: lipoyl(octanoyl) transferase LipB [Planctomycetota bacterium]